MSPSTLPAGHPALTLPLAALVGAGVGLLTGLATDHQWMITAPAVTGGGLVASWTAGLGVVFLESARQRWGAAGLALLLGILGAGQGDLQSGIGDPLNPSGWFLLAVFGGSGLLLLSGWTDHRRWTPRPVPPFAVHSLLSGVIAGILGTLFYALLLLAGQLLEAVGWRGLQQLLGEAEVAAPLVLGASAFFVAAIRAQPWGLALTRTLANVLGFLLPVAAVILLLFAAVLPVAALQDRGALYRGLLSSPLYLTLSGVFVLLTLAAFSARPPALPVAVQALTRVSAFLLPLFSALALYGLGVRIGQYGLTEERLIGLVGAVWLLVTSLALAFTRRSPAFAGLSRATGLSLGILGALTLLLSVPALRPMDWSARSQAARLTRPDLTRRQAAEIVDQLAYSSGPLGKRLLSAIPAAELSPAGRNLRRRSQALSAQSFREQEVWRSQRPGTAEIVLSPGSLPVSDVQQAALRRLVDERRNVLRLSLPYFVHAFPSGSGTRVMVNSRNNWFNGLWVDFDAAARVVRSGTFSPLHPEKGEGVDWNANPFDRSAQTGTITLPVVKAGGAVLILDEDE